MTTLCPVELDTRHYYHQLDKLSTRDFWIGKRSEAIEQQVYADMEHVSEFVCDVLVLSFKKKILSKEYPADLKALPALQSLLAKDYIAFGEYCLKELAKKVSIYAQDKAGDEYDSLEEDYEPEERYSYDN